MPEQNEALVRLRKLYEAYLDKTITLERDRKPGAGWFGFKGGVADDTCHDRFAEELHVFFEDLSASGAESADVREIMEYVISAPQTADAPRAAYWMLIAVQGLGAGLIESLNAADAGELERFYAGRYPRRERLPVQTQILKKLQKQAHG